MLANTRAYDLAFTDGEVRQVLVPFLEFGAINFGGSANVQCLQIDSHMKFKALRDIEKGEIIVQGGTTGSNVDTLINTGFVNLPVPIPFDQVSLEITIDENDPLFKIKLELLEQSTNKFRYGLFNSFDMNYTWEIFSFLRYAHYDEDQSFLLLVRNQVLEVKRNHFIQSGGKPEEWNPSGQFTGSEMNYCTLRCERNMFKGLAKLCLAQLARYKTTLQHDEELIEKNTVEHNLSFNEKNCIHIRIAEKRILHKWLTLSQQILPMLEDGITMKKV